MSPLLEDKESLDLICTGRALWVGNRSKAFTENSRNLSFWTSGDIVQRAHCCWVGNQVKPWLIRDSTPNHCGNTEKLEGEGAGGEGSLTNKSIFLQLPLYGIEGYGSGHPSTNYFVFLSSNTGPSGLLWPSPEPPEWKAQATTSETPHCQLLCFINRWEKTLEERREFEWF